MDQLIRQLEEKITSLISELDTAKNDIKVLRNQLDLVITSENHTLQDNSATIPVTDQLKRYIDDSLDLSIASKKNKIKSVKKKSNQETRQEQLSFDLPQPNNITTESEKMGIDSDKDALSASVPAEKKTTTQTKNQKNNRRLIKLLEERFPLTFNWNNPKPLKIGIDKEIQVDDILTAGKLKRALAAYTRSDRYKKCLQKNSTRIDLNGKQIETDASLIPNKESSKTKIKQQDKNRTARNQTSSNRTEEKQKTANKKDDLANYSQEERMKIKLKQLIISSKTK